MTWKSPMHDTFCVIIIISIYESMSVMI